MRRFATFLAAALVVAVGAAGSTAASAQAPNCGDLYNHLMGLYQAAPQSPEYSQMSAFYSANCHAGGFQGGGGHSGGGQGGGGHGGGGHGGDGHGDHH